MCRLVHTAGASLVVLSGRIKGFRKMQVCYPGETLQAFQP